MFTDELRIKQVLLIFISNAVKFTKSGSICMNAKLNIENKTVMISVKDTGLG